MWLLVNHLRSIIITQDIIFHLLNGMVMVPIADFINVFLTHICHYAPARQRHTALTPSHIFPNYDISTSTGTFPGNFQQEDISMSDISIHGNVS
jgi:hypothetical protein